MCKVFPIYRERGEYRMGIIKKELAKNGEETLSVDGLYLHSKYNPSTEAKRIVTEKFEPEAFTIVFGYGKGYIVNELLEKLSPDQKLLVYEPILNIDNTFELNIVKNLESFKKQFSNLIAITDKINIICSINYEKIAPIEYKNMLQEIKNGLKILEINENTINLATEYWQINYIENLKYVRKDLSIKVLKNNYTCPVVVVSGGPSLTKQLNLLKKIRNKVILISAGSTIKTLMAENIEPDYIISIDGAPINYEHFKDYHFKSAKFVYLMSSYPKIREHFETDCFYAISHTESRLEEHFYSIFKEKPQQLLGGGSVAHYALSLAAYISSGPIALIGQDLAYTDSKTHADNNIQSKTIHEEALLENGAFYVDGFYENKVLTNYIFYSMKETFEQLIMNEAFDHHKVYNCTEGGVNINGIKNLSFRQFVTTYASKNRNDEIVSLKHKEISLGELIEHIEQEIKVIKKISNKLIENISLVNANKSNEYFSNSILGKLDLNDEFVDKELKKTSLGISIDAVNVYILKYFKEEKNETSQQKYSRVKKQSLELYEKLKVMVEKGDLILKDFIAKLKEMEKS